MATSEPLVPKGLPKGSRQQVREGMQRAGIPLAPPGANGVSPTRLRPTPGGVPARSREAQALGIDLSQVTPDQFPFLADQADNQISEPTAPGTVTDALAASAQSEFAQAVMARLMSKRSGT